MTPIFQRTRRAYLLTGALIGWLAVILQLYLIIHNSHLPLLTTIVKYFSYFTILTNILIASYYSVMGVFPATKAGKFFAHPKIPTAFAGYIIIVASIYYLFLRNLWDPRGLQLVVDECLHSVIPCLFIIYWLVFVRKDALRWGNLIEWLIFPLIYLGYILIRGAISGMYPYPFLNVPKLGYTKVFLNSGALFMLFIFLSFFLVAIGKEIDKGLWILSKYKEKRRMKNGD